MHKLDQENSSRALLLAGVRKCGTTTLFHMLARHSAVVPASAKESQFFACDAETVRHNLDWYHGLFDSKQGYVMLDGSTWYFGAPDAPRLINENLEDAKVVICLRDPARRVYSGYLHMKKQTPSKEKRSFEEILSGVEHMVMNGATLYDAESILLDQAVVCGLTDADYISEDFHRKRFEAPFPSRLEDKRFSFRYFSESCYSKWLLPWQTTFGDRLHVVYFEDLLSKPANVVKEILAFAELYDEGNVEELMEKNATRLPKNSVAGAVLAFRKHNRAGKLLANTAKSIGLGEVAIRLKNRFLYASKGKATEGQISRVRALLKDEYDHWSDLDPRTKTIWRND